MMELERHKLSRRGLFGAAGAATAVGALGPWARLARGETTCPVTVPGTILSQSGTISGAAPGLVDAMFDVDPPLFQRQCFSILSSQPRVADHYRLNQVVANERWLVINFIAAVSDHSQSSTFTPGTYSVGIGTNDPDGQLRTVNAQYLSYGKACGYQQTSAASGTVTFTTVTDDLVEATYDLLFGRTSRVQGSYSAPHCVLCAPRPSRTCIRA